MTRRVLSQGGSQGHSQALKELQKVIEAEKQISAGKLIFDLDYQLLEVARNCNKIKMLS